MKFYVGVTDDQWFQFLASRHPHPDEVNFWRPSGQHEHWGPIPKGSLFLFKLHHPNNFIVGGGYFVKYIRLSVSWAWMTFLEKNGADNRDQLYKSIRKYNSKSHSHNPMIGCTLLAEPFFWEKEQWISSPPEWPKNIVQGKSFDSEDNTVGARLWNQVKPLLAKPLLEQKKSLQEVEKHYGTPQIVQPRIGQGIFRALVADAYQWRCSITGERTQPVLEAAHIKPYSKEGPHAVNNGLLMRSDFHILFDRGYIGIDSDFKIKISSKIKEEFKNGREYYAYQNQKLKVFPEERSEYPSQEYLEWHLNHCYERFLA
jgi:putative restriction endonuclease